ncbi:MAG: aminodeoxychorismate synthase component I [Clostridiaceae bacterium]|nr:aminodeoxychorismate synthase component I [Clostridiaceae bacterium]
MRKHLFTKLDLIEVFECVACETSAVFLDSVDASLCDHSKNSRYSVILLNPFGRMVLDAAGLRYLRCDTHQNKLHRKIESLIQSDDSGASDPMALLSRILKLFRYREQADSLPTENGCFGGYIAYDYLEQIEQMPDTQQKALSYPILCLGMFDHSLVYDHSVNELYFCGNERIGLSTEMLDAKYLEIERVIRKREQQETLSGFARKVANDEGIRGSNKTDDCLGETIADEFVCSRALSDFTEKRYMEIVEKAREFIRDGDIFQVNLSQCFQGQYRGNPYHLYRALRTASPSGFFAFARFPEVTLVSSSPERFFHLKYGEVETRPIKGTRPNGDDPEANEANRIALLCSEKDRAELMMIVDLMRNDLGKICQFGKVSVKEPAKLETYRNVFHLVSTIVGEMRAELDAFDVVRALFPGGSITGAPKIRAMEIIRELEPHRRGIYTGSIGYIGFDGTSDLNIAIRTVVFEKERYSYCVGGGIVWDSIPEKEYLETLHKGRSIRESLEIFESDSFSYREEFENNVTAKCNLIPNGRDAIVETFGVSSAGRVSLLKAHVDRLRNSAVALGFGWPFDDDDVVNFIKYELRNTNYRGRVLRMLYFGISGQDCNHKVESPLSPFFRFESRDRYQPISAGGLSLTVHSFKRNPQANMTYHKTTDYLENRLALAAANEKGFDDALFLNSEGEIAETTRHNIFVKIGNTLYTPRIETGILPGVTRAWLIRWAQECGMDVHVIALKQDIFKYADQVFLTNAVVGAMPVKSIHEADELIYRSTMIDAWISEVNAAFESMKE